MAIRIQMRRDILANWNNNNPILAEGEMGLELDTNRWKIGDGTKTWSALEYSNQIFSGPSTIADNSSGTALKITQTGTGDAFLVEDSDTPDSNPFVINNIGYVGIQKTSPSVPLDVAGEANFSGQITSTVSTGSSPFVVSSTTKVANLNVDLLDGHPGSYYASASTLSEYQPLDGDLTAIASNTSNGILKRTASNTWTTITDNSDNWDTAYADRNKWDGGSTGLVVETARTSLGLGTMAIETASNYALLSSPTFTGNVSISDTGRFVGHGATYQVTSTTRPESPQLGDIIYETDTLSFFGWDGTSWNSIGGGIPYDPDARAMIISV